MVSQFSQQIENLISSEGSLLLPATQAAVLTCWEAIREKQILRFARSAVPLRCCTANVRLLVSFDMSLFDISCCIFSPQSEERKSVWDFVPPLGSRNQN